MRPIKPSPRAGSYKIEAPIDNTSRIGRFVGGSGLILALVAALVLWLSLAMQGAADSGSFEMPQQLEASE